ncbi:hypothetical protein [Methylomonas rosea]|uniref:Uncharacterized protein n=1 Tax=Methylomonas rosea TaxID=2952227 RepID=A0ABT1TW71_9GAMM|nr:hypothetical protein [Methylomonas sp. WSC-7]MCQ8118770.1 hypothetical protein [Methylomonas sp. WSC-7]
MQKMVRVGLISFVMFFEHGIAAVPSGLNLKNLRLDGEKEIN